MMRATTSIVVLMGMFPSAVQATTCSVDSLILWDTTAQAPIGPLESGGVIDLGYYEDVGLSIEVSMTCPVETVKMTMTDTHTEEEIIVRTEGLAPYTLGGDINGPPVVVNMVPELKVPGTYMLTVKPKPGSVKTFYFSVVEPTKPVCMADEMMWDAGTQAVLATVNGAASILEGLVKYQDKKVTVGSITALIPEASDASVSGAPVEDGQSGDTAFPHGNLKPIATVGERSVCPITLGEKVVGVPDGLGGYLYDDQTVRAVVQSESYGPLVYES